MEILNTDFNFENINIFNTYVNDELAFYRARPAEGYVMYNTNRNDTEPLLDEDGNQVWDDEGNPVEIPVTYYYVSAAIPLTFNFDNFPWVAVPRGSVDENYIYGGGVAEKPEVM